MSALSNANSASVGSSAGMVEVSVVMELYKPLECYSDFPFDICQLEEIWEEIGQNSFGAESCFFNCYRKQDKEHVLAHLNAVEESMAAYVDCVIDWLKSVKFVEKSRPVPPLPPLAFCNGAEDDPEVDRALLAAHPLSRATHDNITSKIEQFEITENVGDLVGIRHHVEVMKEVVRVYVESNRANTKKYIIKESSKKYTCHPAWMFFPLTK